MLALLALLSFSIRVGPTRTASFSLCRWNSDHPRRISPARCSTNSSAVLVFPLPHLIIAAIIGLTWNSQQRFQRTIALIAVALVCLGGRRSIAATSKVESRNPRTRALERKLEPVLPRKSKPIRFNNRQSGLGV